MITRKVRLARLEKARWNGDWGYEDEAYPRSDWKYEVANNDTQLGYFDWVENHIEAETA